MIPLFVAKFRGYSEKGSDPAPNTDFGDPEAGDPIGFLLAFSETSSGGSQKANFQWYIVIILDKLSFFLSMIHVLSKPGNHISCLLLIFGHTVDGCEILHQLKTMLNIPIKGFNMFQPSKVVQDFFHPQ